MAEAVKVIVRCRPMNGRENDLKCKEVIKIDYSTGQCSTKNPNDGKAPPKSFTFDGAYGTDSTTEQIYADIGYELVEGVTEGYNGTIFAYGQTGCGKSFSMQGIPNPATQRGIIPRAFDHIFETIAVSEGVRYLVHASYLEIYNEDVRDLLGKDVKQKLDLKEHPDRGVYVQGLSMHPVKNVADCGKVMEKGWNNRSTGATLMNADSSRSHSIFSIHMERSDVDDQGEEHIRGGKLNLVDLAGSERQGKTGATGDRLKEATKINLSLSALGNVISALVDGKSKHIPYRDSKLTRLLQDSLGGNTKTLMVACLSPADNNYDETLSTLRYANRAKNIKNKPKINEDPKDALLREFQDEIHRLKAMLRGEIPMNLEGLGAAAAAAAASGGAAGHGPKTQIVEKVVTVADEKALEVERQRIREEYELEMASMKEEYEQMKVSKEKMEEEVSKIREHYDEEMAVVEKSAHNIVSPGQRMEQPLANGVSSQQQLGYDEEEVQYTQTPEGQRAIHLATLEASQQGLRAPSSSPTIDQSVMAAEARKMDPAHTQIEAIQRLQELQQAVVGGEMANNEEIKQKRKKRKKHIEERKKKLKDALAHMDGEEIMLDIYDNQAEELKAKNKILTKEKDKTESLQREIVDLQSEFEFDRIDYLDTIRKQEEQLKYFKNLVDKIHPCLRRDCNYANLDRIKAQSAWDEENQRWNLPKMTIEKTKLPSAGIMPGAGQDPQYKPRMNGEVQASVYDDLRSEDRYLQKLNQSTEQDAASNYFSNKRAAKLLQNTQNDRSRAIGGGSSPNGYMNGGSGGSSGSRGMGGWADEPNGMEQMRGGPMLGPIGGDEFLVRKPTRLESLQPVGRSGKKKKNR